MFIEQSNEEWRQWIKLTKKKESTSSITHEELLLYLYNQEKEECRKLKLELIEAYEIMDFYKRRLNDE